MAARSSRSKVDDKITAFPVDEEFFYYPASIIVKMPEIDRVTLSRDLRSEGAKSAGPLVRDNNRSSLLESVVAMRNGNQIEAVNPNASFNKAPEAKIVGVSQSVSKRPTSPRPSIRISDKFEPFQTPSASSSRR